MYCAEKYKRPVNFYQRSTRFMDGQTKRDPLIERRHHQSNQNNMWSTLTIAQKLSASNLTQYGYELAFIRQSRCGSLAVMLFDGNAATINHEGTIDMAANISIR